MGEALFVGPPPARKQKVGGRPHKNKNTFFWEAATEEYVRKASERESTLLTRAAKAKKVTMAMTRDEWDAAKDVIELGARIAVSKAGLDAAMESVGVREGVTGAVVLDVEGEGEVKEKFVVFLGDGGSSEVRSELEKMKNADGADGADGADAPRSSVVERMLKAANGTDGLEFVRFNLQVDGEAVVVWAPTYPTRGRLEEALTEMVVEAMREPAKGTKAPPESGESDEPMDAKSDEPMETKSEEPAPRKEPAAPEPAAPAAQEEPEAPKAKAMRLREAAREAAEAARRAAEAAREAEEEAEAEEADRREAERASTKEELERAMEESMRAAANVERLRELLARQKEKERQARKRKRSSADESEPRKEGRRVAARHEREEIVMVKDGEFKAVMGQYEGAVHDVVVERFEATGPGGVGPASGGDSVRERVYGTVEGLGEFPVGTKWDGGEVVVVKGFGPVRKFDGVMELGGFVRVVIDVDGRCVNPMSPAEPEWCTDTERVWVKRGSVEHAGLEALIAKGRQSQWRPEWHCPPSPAYRPVGPGYVPASPVGPVDDEEMSVVD